MSRILNRLIGMPFMILGLVTVTFLLTRGIGVDPIYGLLPPRSMSNAQLVAQIRQQFGLDQPLYVQYFQYIVNLFSGDLGTSFRTRQPVLADLVTKLPATFELIIVALMIAAFVGIVLGVVAARFENTRIDDAIRVFALFGSAVPVFWIALVFLYLGSVSLGWFPGPGRFDPRTIAPPTMTGFLLIDSLLAGRMDAFVTAFRALMLPSIVLSWSIVGTVTRLVRASMLETLSSDYILLARAKGVGTTAIMIRHALRASLLSTITVVAHLFGYLLTGAVLVEAIFAWPGIGEYAIRSAQALDYPAIVGVTIVSGITFLLANLAADILYTLADPRIK